MLTPRLQLQQTDAAHLEALIAGPAEFGARFGFYVEDGYLDLPGTLEFALEMLEAHPEQAFWWAPRLVLLRAAPCLIGLAGFKGPPDAAGQVEIGYGIAPAYENRGYATETASALVERAFQDPKVRLVRAHTLAVRNASGSVLRKCGFAKVRELVDEDEGRLWRWEKPRPAR